MICWSKLKLGRMSTVRGAARFPKISVKDWVSCRCSVRNLAISSAVAGASRLPVEKLSLGAVTLLFSPESPIVETIILGPAPSLDDPLAIPTNPVHQVSQAIEAYSLRVHRQHGRYRMLRQSDLVLGVLEIAPGCGEVPAGKHFEMPPGSSSEKFR